MADAAAARPDLVTMIAFNRRYAPLYRLARRRSSEIGPAHSFVARFTRGAIGQDPSTAAGDWVSSDGSHALDLAIATPGVPHQVTVARKSVGAGPDNAWLIQLVSSQGQSVVWLDFAAGRRLERFEWVGPGYDVSLELPDQGGWMHRGGAESWIASEISGSGEFAVNYGFLDEHRAFAEAIAGKAPRPDADFAYGALFMRLIDQILSATSGETRRLDPAAAPIGLPASELPTVRSVRKAPRRPVVAVLQPAAAVRRYFPGGPLAEVSATCDLRFSSETEPFACLSEADAVILGWGAPALTPGAAQSAEKTPAGDRAGRLGEVGDSGRAAGFGAPRGLQHRGRDRPERGRALPSHGPGRLAAAHGGGRHDASRAGGLRREAGRPRSEE